MIQFLSILNDVMRIATFQWRGEVRRGRDGDDRRDVSTHHASTTDRRPIRRFRP